MVAAPCPTAVRRSTASTSVSRAGTSGFPARSIRRNTIPWPAGAGRNVASVAAPVCSPVPRTPAGRVIERLALSGGRGRLGFGLHEGFELVDDLCEAVHRGLGAQQLTVRARGIPGDGDAGGHVGADARLHEQPPAPAAPGAVPDARLPPGADRVPPRAAAPRSALP